MNCILSTAVSICRSLHKGAISRTALWNIVISFHFRFNSIVLEFYNIVLGFCYCNTYFSYQIPRHVRAYYSEARNASQKFLGKLWAQHHYVLRSTKGPSINDVVSKSALLNPLPTIVVFFQWVGVQNCLLRYPPPHLRTPFKWRRLWTAPKVKVIMPFLVTGHIFSKIVKVLFSTANFVFGPDSYFIEIRL